MKSSDYAYLYKTARWQAIRARQLAREPLCALCQQLGIVTAATVCDHVKPHKGDPVAFHKGPFQSLCKPCHDGPKAEYERGGKMRGADIDGWPLSPVRNARMGKNCHAKSVR